MITSCTVGSATLIVGISLSAGPCNATNLAFRVEHERVFRAGVGLRPDIRGAKASRLTARRPSASDRPPSGSGFCRCRERTPGASTVAVLMAGLSQEALLSQTSRMGSALHNIVRIRPARVAAVGKRWPTIARQDHPKADVHVVRSPRRRHPAIRIKML